MTHVTAHVQHCQRHMCSVLRLARSGYPAGMQPEQEIIARWIATTLERKGWTAGEWAKAAEVDPTTITRAIDPSYKSVTSVKTLHALAVAAGETSILEHLGGEGSPLGGVPAISAESLETLLAAILPLARRGKQTAQSIRVVSAALAHGLELLGDQSAKPGNEGALGVAARGAVARFHDLTQQ